MCKCTVSTYCLAVKRMITKSDKMWQRAVDALLADEPNEMQLWDKWHEHEAKIDAHREEALYGTTVRAG